MKTWLNKNKKWAVAFKWLLVTFRVTSICILCYMVIMGSQSTRAIYTLWEALLMTLACSYLMYDVLYICNNNQQNNQQDNQQ